MPETALLGASGDPHEPQIDSAEAAHLVARNCTQKDLLKRIELVTFMFDTEEGSRGPMTAALAHELGFHIHLVGDRSGIGSDLAALGQPIDEAFGADTIVKLIENHRGTFYAMKG